MAAATSASTADFSIEDSSGSSTMSLAFTGPGSESVIEAPAITRADITDNVSASEAHACIASRRVDESDWLAD